MSRFNPSLKTQEAWNAPTLINSWVNTGGVHETAGYYKDYFGNVHLKGRIQGGSIGTVVFVLPVGYRPSATLTLSIVGGGDYGQLSISTDGSVSITSGVAGVYKTLDNVSFRAGA